MRRRSSIFAASALIGLCLLAGCSNSDQAAAADAAEAQMALDQGQYANARQAIQKALATHDDVSEYWLLLARISLATSDLGVAFEAYENAIQLDSGNIEALQFLCQLGLSVRRPDKVDRYADQLLLLTPDDPLPIIMKGAAAFQRGDKKRAVELADSVLAKNPADNSALMLKARVLAAQGDKTDILQAIKIIEEVSSVSKDENNDEALTILKQLYARLSDRLGYQRTMKRLAEAKPQDGALQLEYADMLYQDGDKGAARAVIMRVMKQHPDDIGIASSILDMWLKEGAQAIEFANIPYQASGLSLEMRTVYAQFANEMGRPDIAVTVLGGELSKAPVNVQNSNAKAALAFAMALQGRRSDALHGLDTILKADPSQPRALLARARLMGTAGNLPEAVANARQAVAEEPENAGSRLILVDLLTKQGETQLAETALREAARAMPEEPRIAVRLAALLVGRGQKKEATLVYRDLARAAPMNLRARRLWMTLDPAAKKSVAGKEPDVAVTRPGAG